MNSQRDTPPATTPLASVLRGGRTAAFFADAALIRDASAAAGRDDETRRVIREAMLLSTFGRITREERNRICDILSFVVAPLVPPACRSATDAYFDSLDTHEPAT